MSHLGRRELIGLLGGLAAWPLPLGAQPLALPVVGVLVADRRGRHVSRRGVPQGLKETGYVEGQNVVIEYRFAENDYARLPGLAANLVQRQVNVLAAIGNAASRAAKQATTTVPIVSDWHRPGRVRHGRQSGAAGRQSHRRHLSRWLVGAQAVRGPARDDAKAPVLAMLENPTNPNAGTVRSEVQAAPMRWDES